MRIVVDEELKVYEPSQAFQKWCKHNMIISNPEYLAKERMGKWTGNIAKHLYMYRQIGDVYILGQGCLNQVVKEFNVKDIRYNHHKPQKVDYKGSVPLYDYQEVAVDELVKAGGGVLQSPPGSGKTQMGIALICKLGLKALWVTHTLDLLSQSKSRAALYMDTSLFGDISSGKVHIGKGITFATVQTLSSLNLQDYRDEWDVVIVDECHRCAGTPTSITEFGAVLSHLNAQHKYGLSATVHRSDGLIRTMFSYLGDISYSVPQEAVADKIMQVNILKRCTNIELPPEAQDTDGTLIYQKLITSLTENSKRNMMIVNDLACNGDHYCLILSDRIAHLKELYSYMDPEDASIVDGTMVSKKGRAEREQAIQDMRDGKKHFLFASYKLAKEGLDIPRLDRLFLTTPQKDYAIVTQSIGRVDRTFPGKSTPVVYDYVDSIGYTVNMFKKRCRHYKKAGCFIL